MTKRHFILPLFLSLMSLCSLAQSTTHTSQSFFKSLSSDIKLNSLNLGVTAGTTGLGVELELPVLSRLNVRAGVNYTPRTNIPMTFNLMSYAGDNADPNMSDDDRFNRLSELMEQFTGMKVDREVKTHAKGTMVDFKFLIDFYPLRNNRHWYATAGFYWGSSKVGHIENTIDEAPSLMGVVMYNKLYDFFVEQKYFFEPIYGDVFIDPMVGMTMEEKFLRYGRVGAHLGDFKEGAPIKAGTPYLLEPDENGTVHADMYVHSFKPYVGIGYTACISKDGRWNIGFDAGALFWGKPKILTHENYIYYSDGTVGYGTVTDPDFDGVIGPAVDVAKDVEGITGKVGSYCKVAKSINVYPVLNFKISYKLF